MVNNVPYSGFFLNPLVFIGTIIWSMLRLHEPESSGNLNPSISRLFVLEVPSYS